MVKTCCPLSASDDTFAIAVGNDEQFARLCEQLGLPALTEDERFATNAARVENRAALAATLSGVVRMRCVAHWTTALVERGVPSRPVNDMAQAFEDPTRASSRVNGTGPLCGGGDT